MSRWIVCAVEPRKDECSTLAVAARLATTMGTRLALVTVVPDVEDPDDVVAHSMAGRRTLSEAARKCRLPDDAVHRVEFGAPVEGLQAAADDLRAAFIVVGETSRSALSRLLRPGVDRELVEGSNRPIVVVPRGSETAFAQHAGIGGSIICGVGSQDGHPLAAFAAAFAGELGVRPILVTATPGEAAANHAAMPAGAGSAPAIAAHEHEAAVQRVLDAAAGAGVDTGAIVMNGEPISAIEEVAAAEHACAIVVGTRRRNWLARLVRGSVSVRLARTSSRPVVVVPSGS